MSQAHITDTDGLNIPDICEGCMKPNVWKLMDKEYSYVCGECAERRKGVVYTPAGYYRYIMHCSGTGCEGQSKGTANWLDKDTGRTHYYCGCGELCDPPKPG